MMSRKKTMQIVFAALAILIAIWMAPLFLEPGTYLRYGLEEFRVISMGVGFGLGSGYVLFRVKRVSKSMAAEAILGFIAIGVMIWGLPLLLDPASNLRFAVEELRVLIIGVNGGFIASFPIFYVTVKHRHR